MIAMERRVRSKGLAFNVRGMEGVLWKAFIKAAQWYHANIVPKHFTKAGGAEYLYAGRTEEHNKRKKRLFPENAYTPLVFTGRSRLEVLRWLDVRKSSKGVAIFLHPPVYFWKIASGSRVDKGAELTAVSRRDEQKFMAALDTAFKEEVRKFQEGREELQSLMG